jgi:hypothetical protein
LRKKERCGEWGTTKKTIRRTWAANNERDLCGPEGGLVADPGNKPRTVVVQPANKIVITQSVRRSALPKKRNCVIGGFAIE